MAGVNPWGPLRNNRPPSWKFEATVQICRTILEFDGINTAVSKAPVEHRLLTTITESRAPGIQLTVHRDKKNPFGSAPEFIRNKGAQFRMQGFLENYKETETISPTELCRRMGNGLLTESEYWKESLLELSLGPPRNPQWIITRKKLDYRPDLPNDYTFPLVKEILKLAELCDLDGGLTPAQFCHAFMGNEDCGVKQAYKRIVSDSDTPQVSINKDAERGIREIMQLMAKYKPKGGGVSYGAGWLFEKNGAFYTSEAGKELLATFS